MSIPADHIKHAARLAKKFETVDHDILRVQVAVQSDSKVSRLPHESQQSVCSLLQGHLDRTLPLPTRAGRYSRNEWNSLRYRWLRECPESQSIKSVIDRWTNSLTAEIGESLFRSVFYKGFAPGHNLYSHLEGMYGTWWHMLSEIDPSERTPAALAEFMNKVKTSFDRLRMRCELLSDVKLYQSNTDPQYVVDKLLDTEAHYDIERILIAAHGVQFGSQYEKDIPDVYDMLDRRCTVADVLERRQAKNDTQKASRLSWRQRFIESVVAATKDLESLDTLHLPTLNRRLKKADPDFRITRSKRNSGQTTCARFEFMRGSYTGVEAPDSETALSNLLTELEYMASHYNPDDALDDDRFYSLHYKAADKSKTAAARDTG